MLTCEISIITFDLPKVRVQYGNQQQPKPQKSKFSTAVFSISFVILIHNVNLLHNIVLSCNLLTNLFQSTHF